MVQFVHPQPAAGAGWGECMSSASLRAPSRVLGLYRPTRDDKAYDIVRHLCWLNDTDCSFNRAAKFPI